MTNSPALARHGKRDEEDKVDRSTKRWEDNIRKWTGPEFPKCQRAVENRENGGSWL